MLADVISIFVYEVPCIFWRYINVEEVSLITLKKLLQSAMIITNCDGTRLFGRHLKGFNILWKKGQATVSSRITNHSEMLIDLIVTNRGTCPLGISDHDMIYATLSTSIPRDPPKII